MNSCFTTTENKMNEVKAAWDQAPPGPKKAAALIYYQDAEMAKLAKNDADCLKSLDAASAALA